MILIGTILVLFALYASSNSKMGAVGLVLLMVAFAGKSALLMEEVGKKKKLKSKPKPKRRAKVFNPSRRAEKELSRPTEASGRKRKRS